MQSIYLYLTCSILLVLEIVSSSYKSPKIKERGKKVNDSCKSGSPSVTVKMQLKDSNWESWCFVLTCEKVFYQHQFAKTAIMETMLGWFQKTVLMVEVWFSQIWEEPSQLMLALKSFTPACKTQTKIYWDLHL